MPTLIDYYFQALDQSLEASQQHIQTIDGHNGLLFFWLWLHTFLFFQPMKHTGKSC
jgi:hypothetical protein